jgi:hypothetical protein
VKPHQLRVVEEKMALDNKIALLKAFMAADKYWQVPPTERRLLRIQFSAMEDYSHALGCRISLWTESHS